MSLPLASCHKEMIRAFLFTMYSINSLLWEKFSLLWEKFLIKVLLFCSFMTTMEILQ